MLKRKTMKRILTIQVLLLLVMASSVSCSLGPNLLPNGSFEIASEVGGDPSGWHATRVPQTANFVKFGAVESGFHSGRRSAFIEIDSAHPTEVKLDPQYVANRIDYNWTIQTTDCKPGGLYVLSGWIKAQDLKAPAFIMVQCIGNIEKYQVLGYGSTERDYPVLGTSDWTRVATVFSVPEGTVAVRLRAGISSPQNIGGKAWFDNIQIRELR